MKRFSMKRFPRGQALTETTIALPLFLMGLFGVMWAVREGAMSERVQMGVRYGGVVTQLSNPYASYSLYAKRHGRRRSARRLLRSGLAAVAQLLFQPSTGLGA
jgi:hypothetical protein